MRNILVMALIMGVAGIAKGDDKPDSGYEIVVTVGIPVLSYTPAVAVKPKGDVHVGKLPSADMISSAEVRSRIGFLRSDARLSMTDAGGSDGPSVIGTHFRALIEPFTCSVQEDYLLDLPWRNPCIGFGYAYRGDHNILDQAYGKSVLTHSIQAHLRLFSADGGGKDTWLWGEWIASGAEPSFVLTKDTDAAARELEVAFIRAGATARLSFWENGRIDVENTLVFSKRGLASFQYRLRYLHALDVGVLDGDAVAMDFSIFIGAEFGGGVNVRKEGRLGQNDQSFQLLVGMPIGR